MLQKQSQVHTQPETFITTQKNRRRIIDGNLYLPDKTEFEVELNNRTSDTLLAKILMNGKLISSGGIVLRPGEHAFIERYLDSPRKFIFDLYDIPGGNESAISNNGLIEIRYYQEQAKLDFSGSSWTINTTDVSYFDFTTTGYGSPELLLDSSSNINYKYSRNTNPEILTHKKSKKIETGIIREGDKSNQQFISVNKEFNNWTICVHTFHILPESQVSYITPKDIKVYCSQCGRKQRKVENYCPKCGFQF